MKTTTCLTSSNGSVFGGSLPVFPCTPATGPWWGEGRRSLHWVFKDPLVGDAGMAYLRLIIHLGDWNWRRWQTRRFLEFCSVTRWLRVMAVVWGLFTCIFTVPNCRSSRRPSPVILNYAPTFLQSTRLGSSVNVNRNVSVDCALPDATLTALVLSVSYMDTKGSFAVISLSSSTFDYSLWVCKKVKAGEDDKR